MRRNRSRIPHSSWKKVICTDGLMFGLDLVVRQHSPITTYFIIFTCNCTAKRGTHVVWKLSWLIGFRFILFSPDHAPNLYLYPFLHPGAQQSQVDVDNIDFEAFPAFKNAKAIEVRYLTHRRNDKFNERIRLFLNLVMCSICRQCGSITCLRLSSACLSLFGRSYLIQGKC